MKAIVLTILASLFSFTTGDIIATYKTDKANSSMTITGTSTLHDWEMQVTNINGIMDVDLYNTTIDIKSLKLSVPVESLKSGKSPMDNNAYKALKSEAHPKIHYELTRVKSITPNDERQYRLVTEGKLTVAGITRTLTIPLTANIRDNALELKGRTTFKMTDFGVEPPSFMFGKVNTGDEITITFDINYKSTQK